jgi:hypothetical protein
MKPRSLLATALLVLTYVAAASPAAAQGLVEYALILVVAKVDGAIAVGDLQMSDALTDDCASTRRTRRECAALEALAGQDFADVVAELFQEGWELAETVPVEWTGPELESDLDCEISLGEDAIDLLVLSGGDGSETQASIQYRDFNDGTYVWYQDVTESTDSTVRNVDLTSSDHLSAFTCADLFEEGFSLEALAESSTLAGDEQIRMDYDLTADAVQRFDGMLYVYTGSLGGRR